MTQDRLRMFAVLASGGELTTLKPGDLVVVEVPDNCTIHDTASERLSRLRSACTELRALYDAGTPVNNYCRDELIGRIVYDADPPQEHKT